MINKKVIVIFTILITIINTLMPVVNAISELAKANLIYDHKLDTHIMYYNEERQEWRKIQFGYISYEINGKKYPFDDFDDAYYDLYEETALDELLFNYSKQHLKDFIYEEKEDE